MDIMAQCVMSAAAPPGLFHCCGQHLGLNPQALRPGPLWGPKAKSRRNDLRLSLHPLESGG
jgi:hypothetical protein